MQRNFKSGSRQAPDPFDQFLEVHNFYRKHTARDSSCLFRVISEQMYDTQLHHLIMRKKCVTYMRKHRSFFNIMIDKDFDAYLEEMSNPKTYGTLLELQAAGYMFQRNILLFEPFTLGTYFNENNANFSQIFRVFYTPGKHFDSVFTAEYIQEAAICQSLCYEILYKDVFRLPDIDFAVEHMLYGYSFDNIKYGIETNSDGYNTRLFTEDGREFDFDLPQNTKYDLQRKLRNTHRNGVERNNLLIRANESLLPNKYISCVRQLLLEGITPFSYKVAKALDQNIYRNIEFDSWKEIRKEMKLENWYNGDSNFKLISYPTRTQPVPNLLQVGAKCFVKLYNSEEVFTCHIQEIAVDKSYCVVFVEQLGEKRWVPYESLSPVPADQFKPWNLPYRFQRHLHKCSSVRFMRHYNYKLKLNASPHRQLSDTEGISDAIYASNVVEEQNYKYCPSHCSYEPYYERVANASLYKFKQYTYLENFRTHTVNCQAMPTLEEKKLTTAENDKDPEYLPSGLNNCFPSFPVHSRNVNNNIMESHFRIHANNKLAIDSNFNSLSDKSGLVYASNLYPINSCAMGLSADYCGYNYNNNMQLSVATLMSPMNCMAPVIYSHCNPINSYLLLSSNNSANVISQTPTYDVQYSHPLYTLHKTPILTNGCPSQVQLYATSAFDVSNPDLYSNSIVNINDWINCNAQKFCSINGVDLPTNVSNIGLICYHRHLNQENVKIKMAEKEESLEDFTISALPEGNINAEDDISKIEFSRHNCLCSNGAQASHSNSNTKINSLNIKTKHCW